MDWEFVRNDDDLRKIQRNKLDCIVEHMRNFWWMYVIYAVTTGIIALFIYSFIYDKEITVNVMNSWVGTILGLVALVIGVISMFLSFYNLDQSIRTQKETISKMDQMKTEIINYVKESSNETIDEIHKSSSNQPEVLNPKKGDWGNVND